MHSADEQNYERGYEWWLMREAKRRNPDIKVGTSPHAFPLPAGRRLPLSSSLRLLTFPSSSLSALLSLALRPARLLRCPRAAAVRAGLGLSGLGPLRAARTPSPTPPRGTSPTGSREHGTCTDCTSTTVSPSNAHPLRPQLTRRSSPRGSSSAHVARCSPLRLAVCLVGLWNEKSTNRDYTLTLRRHLDAANITTHIITADGGWGICDDLVKDAEYSAAVYALGAHYPNSQTSSNCQALASTQGKRLWASEDFSTLYNAGGCWARLLGRNYVNANLTSTISWNLGSFLLRRTSLGQGRAADGLAALVGLV